MIKDTNYFIKRLKISGFILSWAQHTFYIIYHIFVFFWFCVVGGGGVLVVVYSAYNITDMLRGNNRLIPFNLSYLMSIKDAINPFK